MAKLPQFVLSLIAVAPRAVGVEFCSCALQLRHCTLAVVGLGRWADKDQGAAQGDAPMSGRRAWRHGGLMARYLRRQDGRRR